MIGMTDKPGVSRAIPVRFMTDSLSARRSRRPNPGAAISRMNIWWRGPTTRWVAPTKHALRHGPEYVSDLICSFFSSAPLP